MNDLKSIEEKAAVYKAQISNLNSNNFAPLKINLVINFSLLAEIVGEFAEMLINEPEQAYELLLQLIIVSINVLTDWDIDTKMVHLLLRLDSLPNVPQLKLKKESSPIGLFNFQGVLISRTTPAKYLISTIFECKDVCCPGNQGERVFPKMTVEKCIHCSSERIERTNAKFTADHVLGIFMASTFLQSPPIFTRCQGITIDFKEDLYPQLELGIQYNIIAKKELEGFVAWGLKPMLPEPLVRALKKYTPSPFPAAIVEAFDSVRENCGTSPWAIVNFLASQVAICSYPVSSFMQLKTGLLLSLASTQGRKCPTSVLALGECGQILNAASRLCPRSLMVTSNLWTAASGDVSLCTDSAWLQAGPLLLASYGVLFVGNLPKIGSTFCSQILSAVDSELVTLQQKPGYCTVDPKILTYPLKSAVWSHWKCNKYSWHDIHQLRTLIDVFGMPFLTEIGCDDETLSNTIISHAVGNENNENVRIIEEVDFREFISIVSAQEVEMSEAASSLIKQYFVASRLERPDCLPIKAVKVLTGMCEAHAKLSLRTIATYEDAVAAVYLYEESIVALFGNSILSEEPKRKCNSTDSFDVAKEMDYTLTEFADWLDSYVNALNIADKSKLSNNSSGFL